MPTLKIALGRTILLGTLSGYLALSACAALNRPPSLPAEKKSEQAVHDYLEKWKRTISSVQRGCTGPDHEKWHGGTASGAMEIKDGQFTASTGLSQDISAKKYRGRRLRLEAYLSTQDVRYDALSAIGISAAAFLEAQVVGQLNEERCQSAPISGTSDWQKLTLSFDVPKNADVITVGVLLVGRGKAWVDDFRLSDLGRVTQTPLRCADTFYGRPHFGTSVTYQADAPDLLDADFEEKPPFTIDPEARKTCRPESPDKSTFRERSPRIRPIPSF